MLQPTPTTPPTYLNRIRISVWIFSMLLSVFLFLAVEFTVPGETLQIIRLTQLYAFTALSYLYLALLATPFTQAFPHFPWRAQYIKARRAMGISVFYFGFLHAYLAFFKQLGGFAGLWFLTSKYLWAIGLSFTALVIFALMASTSNDRAIRFLTYARWKLLHRFVYLAGTLVLIHALLLGTHFADLSSTIPYIAFALLFVLLLLQAIRIDKWIGQRIGRAVVVGPTFFAVVAVSVFAFLRYIRPTPSQPSGIGIHSQHLQQIQSAEPQVTVRFDAPQDIIPNTDTKLTFQVFDIKTNQVIRDFLVVQEKKMHLVIVDNELISYQHVHPTLLGDKFEIDVQFPHEGLFHLYFDYQPANYVEQNTEQTIQVGKTIASRSTQQPDRNLSKTVGGYIVTAQVHGPLQTSELSRGQAIIGFTVTDTNSQTVTTLKPYLGAFGHMVMINQETYEYLHVHPTTFKIPSPNETAGPTVSFAPFSLFGTVKPGIYRVFMQLNPNGELITVDYTFQVEES